MKKIFIKSLGFALIMGAISTSQAQTNVVYANSTTLFDPPGPNTFTYLSLANGDFVGNTITLAPSTSATRNMIGFGFQYYTDSANHSTYASIPSLTLSFYLNGGALVNGVPSPSTQFFTESFILSSFVVPPGGGGGNIGFTNGVDFASSGTHIPAETVTWTLQVSGMGAGDVFGLVAFDPPTVGYDANYYWQNIGGVWSTRTNSVAGANSFGAEVWATTPEPGTVSLAILGGLTLLAAVKGRRRS